MDIIIYFFVFVFGIIIGSFLNCVIYRLALPGSTSQSNLGKFKSRSFCPKCRHQLGFFDLIPILSFFVLKGKCRYCREKISWQYPLVEILTGLIFLLIFNFQFSIFNEFSISQFSNLIYLSVISCLLIIIFVYDLKHYLIPDKIIYPAIVIVFLFNIFNSYIINDKSFFNLLLTAFAAGMFFFLIWLVSRGQWMGFGDVKLAFFMGLFLGFPIILPALFSAFFIGAIIGLGLIILGKKTLKSRVPFGPFLIIGTFLALFLGKDLINWYLNLII